MKYNGTMNNNLQYGSTRVNICTYSLQMSFHMNHSTLCMYGFEIFTITLIFTITQINEDINI